MVAGARVDRLCRSPNVRRAACVSGHGIRRRQSRVPLDGGRRRVDHRESRARTARPHRRHVGCAKVENDADIGVWHRSPDVACLSATRRARWHRSINSAHRSTSRKPRCRAAYKSRFELCRNCVRCPRNSPTNTDVYRFTSRSMLWREVVESTARRGVSVSLGERRQNCFPSVLLQPLGHLSALESTTCERSTNGLSHTPALMPSADPITFVFGDLEGTEGARPQELCKTS